MERNWIFVLALLISLIVAFTLQPAPVKNVVGEAQSSYQIGEDVANEASYEPNAHLSEQIASLKTSGELERQIPEIAGLEEQSEDGTSARFFIELEEPPVTAASKSSPLTPETAQRGLERVAQAQERALEKARGLNIALEKRPSFARFSLVANGFAAELNPGEPERLEALPEVKAVHEDITMHVHLDTSVPLTNAPALWKTTDDEGRSVDGTGVTVAVIDTGVDYTHPVLGGCFGPGCKVAGGYDFYFNDPDPMDDHSHGTHVASTIAGNGRMKGTAPGATIYAYKVLSPYGSGSAVNILKGIERAMDPNQDGNMDDRVDIISMSLGTLVGSPDDPFSQAVDNAFDAGTLVVVSAGNSGSLSGTIGSPGMARKALTVGATKRDGTIASFSSRGPVYHETEILLKPEIIAPGVAICAAMPRGPLPSGRTPNCGPTNQDLEISGTSMSTPMVSGVAALLKQKYPEWDAQQLRDALIKGASHTEGLSTEVGLGMLDAQGAVATAERGQRVYLRGFDFEELHDDRNGRISQKDLLLLRFDFKNGEQPIARAEARVRIGEQTRTLGLGTLSPGETFSLPVSYEVPEDAWELGMLVTILSKGKEVDYQWINLPVEPALEQSWSLPEQDLRGYTVPAMADLNADGTQELYVVSDYQLLGWSPDGTALPGFPMTLDSGGYDTAPAVLDVDLDGRDELIVVSQDKLYVIKSGGNIHASRALPVANQRQFPSAVRVFEHRDEVYILIGIGNEIHLLDGSLNTREGWPIQISRPFYQLVSSPALADITFDGDPEVIYTDRRTLHVVDSAAEPMWGWPVQLNAFAGYGGPTVGDVVGDQYPEIILFSTNALTENQLYVFDREGNLVPGWPKDFTGLIPVAEPALIDLTGNNRPEIIVSAIVGEDADTFIYSGSGNLLGTHAFGNFVRTAPVALGGKPPRMAITVGGGGNLFPSLSGFFVIEGTRNVLTSVPGILDLDSSSPLVADIDGDGAEELIQIFANKVQIFSLPTVADDTIDWSRRNSDSKNSAQYNDGRHPTCSEDSIIGDTNGDGRVAMDDLALLMKIAVHLYPEPDNLCCVDISRDGAVSSMDGSMLYKHIEGIPQERIGQTCESVVS